MSEVHPIYEKEYSVFVNNVRAKDKERKVHLPEEEDINKIRMYCIKDILSVVY